MRSGELRSDDDPISFSEANGIISYDVWTLPVRSNLMHEVSSLPMQLAASHSLEADSINSLQPLFSCPNDAAFLIIELRRTRI